MSDLFVYIDLKRAKHVTMGNISRIINNIRREHPDESIFIDGDLYAVVGRRKA